jgi:LmbE family N-acetylglucosaminyl deacetylase
VKILALGAHFDDVELGCGGSLLAWKAQGHSTSIFVATRSGYADAHGNIIRSDAAAQEEGRRAAKLLGAELFEGGLPTLELEFGETLNCKILSVLEQVKPDIVLTHWPGDVQHDHQALARSSIQCCRHVQRIATYCSNWYEGADRFDPRFYVDISAHLDQKVKLIEIHASENSRTGGKWIEYVRAQARIAGLRAGVQYAEAFELVRWLH